MHPGMRIELRAWAREAHQAFKRASRHPKVALFSSISIAVGIAANTFLFSAFEAVLNPKQYVDIEQLVKVREIDARGTVSSVSAPAYRDMKRQQRSMTAVAAYSEKMLTVSIRPGESDFLDGVFVSTDLLEVLKVSPIIGRQFQEDEFLQGGPNSVLISYDLWNSRFGSQRDILGYDLTIDGESRRVVGVMPIGFKFPWSADVWIPSRAIYRDESRTWRYLQMIGRLRPNSDIEAAQAEFNMIMSRAISDTDVTDRRNALLTPMDESVIESRLKISVALLLLSAGFVLIIVALNIASVQTADSVRRRHNTAVFLALGASRAAVFWRILTENVIIALIGGIAGVIGSVGLIRFLTIAFSNEIPFWMEIRLTPAAVMYAMALSVVVGVIAGLQPAIQSSRTALSSHAGGASGDREGARWLRWLLVGQIATAYVLLMTSLASMDGLRNIENDDLGFSVSNRSTMSIRLFERYHPTARYRAQVTDELLSRIRSIAGAQRAEFIHPMPLKDVMYTVKVLDAEDSSEDEAIWAAHYACTAGLFSVLEIPLLAGEGFREGGSSHETFSILVNRKLATLYWGNDIVQALNKPLTVSDNVYRVIGVVEDFRHFPAMAEPNYAVFRPIREAPPWTPSVVVDSGISQGAIQSSIRSVVGQFDNTLGVSDVESLDDLLNGLLSKTRLVAFALTMFAALAIAVVSIGTYGQTSSFLAWRARELAIRRALGSTSGRVIRLVLYDVLRLTCIASCAGILLSMPVLAALKSAVYGISEISTVTYLLVLVAMAASVAVATAMPCFAALRSSPWQKLGES